MKFIDASGGVLDVYQSITQLPDEQWLKGNLFSNFEILLEALDAEGYTFNVNLHTRKLESMVAESEGLQILITLTSEKYPCGRPSVAAFLQKRDAAEFAEILCPTTNFPFQLHVPLPGDGLTSMVPKTFGDKNNSQ